MRNQIKFFVLGFIVASFLGIGGIMGFLFFASSNNTVAYHEQKLGSGKKIKVTMFNLVWGREHDEQFAERDCFALGYVMASPSSEQQAKDQEAMEVFELIRPISEQWSLDHAQLYAFPTAERKGDCTGHPPSIPKWGISK